MGMGMVAPEQLAEGTGSMQLFDLEEDPGEHNDLSQSTNAEHQEALSELIDFARREATEGYVGLTPESQIEDPDSYPSNYGGALHPGWCEDTLAVPDAFKCNAAKEPGSGCDSTSTRYFYNYKEGSCEAFQGCPADGFVNNFATSEQCEDACM